MTNIARILLTIAAIQYGFVPPIVDLSDSHVFHIGWPPHARFHMVWLLCMGSGMAAFVLYLIWGPARDRLHQLKLTSILGIIIFGGFFTAAIFRSIYGGALADPEHQILVLGIDGNVFAFGIAALLQISAMAIIWTRPRQSP